MASVPRQNWRSKYASVTANRALLVAIRTPASFAAMTRARAARREIASENRRTQLRPFRGGKPDPGGCGGVTVGQAGRRAEEQRAAVDRLNLAVDRLDLTVEAIPGRAQ